MIDCRFSAASRVRRSGSATLRSATAGRLADVSVADPLAAAAAAAAAVQGNGRRRRGSDASESAGAEEEEEEEEEKEEEEVEDDATYRGCNIF